MEPYAINTTTDAMQRHGDGAVLDTEGVLMPFALNTGGEGSGKTGPPQGRVLSSLAAAARSSDGNGTVFTDLALHLGDLAYATGYASEWDRFLSQLEPLSSRVPLMVVQGNHERDWPGSGSAFSNFGSGGECGVPMEARFPMPTPSKRQEDYWYSFEQGPAHFLMMDTEVSAWNGSSQLAFIEADLSAVDRLRTPWVIFGGHRPMYSSTAVPYGPYRGPNADPYDLVDGPWWREVEAVMLRHKVDLALSGHVHNVEVTCPMSRGKCVPTGGDQHGIVSVIQSVTVGRIPPLQYDRVLKRHADYVMPLRTRTQKC